MNALPRTIARRVTVQPDGCWTWNGHLTEKGYGQVWWHGRTRRVHRLTYELLVGAIPAGLELHHRCEVESCCNPAHLEPCTSLYNTNQKADVNKTHCLRGHALTPENTRVQERGGHIHRACKTCARERKAAARQPTARAGIGTSRSLAG